MSTTSPPFIFGIPFRSKASSKDWARSQALLASTLRSVFSQTDSDFQVVIACHETPDIAEIRDPRVTVLNTATPTPTNLVEQMRDKGHKRKMLTVEWRRRGGGYFMLLDADDLVSRRLVQHVRENPAENGYLIKQGYLYDVAAGSCKPSARLNEICGSCTIFRMDPEDLPESIEDETPRLIGKYRNHQTFEEDGRRLGRAFGVIPFPAAIYVIGHGENYTADKRPPGLKKHLHRAANALSRAVGFHRLRDQVRDEFTLRGADYAR